MATNQNVRKQFSSFRLRSFFCPQCSLHIQFFGNDPVVGNCPCGTPLTELKLESDNQIDTHKTVTNLLIDG